MKDVEEFLKSNQIEYKLHEHPPVYTVEEAAKYCGDIPGLACKNLFIRDKESERYFLITLPADKRFDFKKFGDIVGTKKLTFADNEALKEKLGLEAGAVSPFGLLNDHNQSVKFYIDKKVYDANIVNFHPNVNTASLELAKTAFWKFLKTIKHEFKVINLV